jgi:hypothetical protein
MSRGKDGIACMNGAAMHAQAKGKRFGLSAGSAQNVRRA